MLTRYLKAKLFCAAGMCLTACDFEEKNLNPNESTVITPGPLLNYTQLNTSVDGHTKNMQIGCCMMMVQQTASLESTEAGVDAGSANRFVGQYRSRCGRQVLYDAGSLNFIFS